MKKLSFISAIWSLALVLPPMASLQAAELRVLAGGSMTAVLNELAPQFEHASGHKLVIHFDSTPNLIKLATSGEPFDLGVVPIDVFKDAAAKARFAPPHIDIAHVGYGVAVRLGIGEMMNAKTKVQTTTGQIAQAVAKGDAELGVFLVNVLMAPGVEIAGLFPAELQQELVFTAATATDTKQADAARAFIDYLTSPAAAAVIKNMGLSPG
jgi:molybdate transport system substrate-binding protein